MISVSSIANVAANIFGFLTFGLGAVAAYAVTRSFVVRKEQLREHARDVAKLVGTTKQTVKTPDQEPNVLIIPGSGSIEIVTSGSDSPNVKVSIERSKTAHKELRIANG
jgi:hypothetical protein